VIINNPLRRPVERILFFLVIIGIVVLSLPERTKLQFTNTASNILLYPVVFISGRLIELKLLNRDLSTINNQLNKALVELNLLKSSEKTAVISTLEIVPAMVVMRDLETNIRLLTIDRGKANNIDEGLPVVYEGHLIGRIIESSNNQSIIETILNPGFRVSVQHKRTETRGILETTGERIEIKYFPRNVDINVGDTIITSGIGSFAPPGLVVGRIEVVKSGEDLFFQELRLLPFKNIGSLSRVYILPRR